MTAITIIILVLLFAAKKCFFSSKNIGKLGERRVARKLRRLPKDYITINDILLTSKDGTTQIDHIVISPFGLFVIETKNYKGWIFGHENSEEWKQSLLGEKKIWGWSSEQHKFRNPIRQNYAHTQAVQTLLTDIGHYKIIPIVVFSNRADLNITTPNHIVINRNNLNSTIRSFQTPCINHEDIHKIIAKISASNITTKESRNNHIKNIKIVQRNFESAIEKRTCPKCGGQLIERKGQYGLFLGCSNYPKCRFTHKL